MKPLNNIKSPIVINDASSPREYLNPPFLSLPNFNSFPSPSQPSESQAVSTNVKSKSTLIVSKQHLF